jgi:colanic acid biosynthesis glycosyl transferase WcaI
MQASPTARDLAGLQVLVVGINHSPETTGIAPYTTKASQHLALAGANVEILAGIPHYPHWKIPREYRFRARSEYRLEKVLIRRLRHYVPSRQSAIRRGIYELTFGMHVASARPRNNPDVVLAIVPSLLGALAARRKARKHGARLIVWVQDLMGPATQESGIPGGRRVTRITKHLEALILKSADAVLVLNEAFASYAVDAGVEPSRVTVVRNWVHVGRTTSDRRTVRRELGWRDDCLIVLHTGNMGLKQDLENVISTAALARDLPNEVMFVLMGDGSQRDLLITQSEGVDNVCFLWPVDEERYADVLAAADVLLVNERPSAVEMSLPSKLTSYLQAGRPIVAAVNARGATAREVVASGAGLVVPPGDPAALLEGVLRFANVDKGAVSRAARAYVSSNLTAEASLSRLTTVVLGDRPP